jgi:hypothetical protein
MDTASTCPCRQRVRSCKALRCCKAIERGRLRFRLSLRRPCSALAADRRHPLTTNTSDGPVAASAVEVRSCAPLKNGSRCRHVSPDVIPVVTRADLAWLEIGRTMVSCRPLAPLVDESSLRGIRAHMCRSDSRSGHSRTRRYAVRRVREMHRRHAKSQTPPLSYAYCEPRRNIVRLNGVARVFSTRRPRTGVFVRTRVASRSMGRSTRRLPTFLMRGAHHGGIGRKEW